MELTQQTTTALAPRLSAKAREDLAEVDAILKARLDLAFMMTANPKQNRMLASQARIVFYVGPNKMGKSTAQILKALKIGIEEPGSIIWLCSETFDTSRTTQQRVFAELCPQQFIKHGTYKPESGYHDKTVVFHNGTVFHMKSYDAGFEVAQGAQKVRFIGLDEEPLDRKFYEECFMRTADHPRGQIAFSMTWLHGFTWVYHDIFMSNKPYVEVIQGEVGDNDLNLPPGATDALKAEFAGTGLEESRIYGRCCAVGGRPVFDAGIITQLIKAERVGLRYSVDYVNGKSIVKPEKYGKIEVFAPPEEDKNYVIGVDSCEGLKGKDSDKAALWVLNKLTPCAVFWGSVAPDELGEIAHAVAMWYNGATIVVERNGVGAGTLATLQRNRYPKIWRDRAKKDAPPGFWHGERTYRQTVTDCASAIRQKLMVLHHRSTLLEMSTFIYNDADKPEAQVGCHDDLVWALNLAMHGVLTAGGNPVGRSPRDVVVVNEKKDATNVRVMWDW